MLFSTQEAPFFVSSVFKFFEQLKILKWVFFQQQCEQEVKPASSSASFQKQRVQAFSSLPASSNQVRRRGHNHKNRNQNDWRNFGPNVFYSRPAVGTPGQSNRKNSGGENSGVGLGGSGVSNGSTDVFENLCSIKGMLAEAMAEQRSPELPFFSWKTFAF